YELLRPIHNRVPVILTADDEDLWFDRGASAADVLSLLRPFDSDRMEAYPVSHRVGSPASADPDLVAPLAPASHLRPRWKGVAGDHSVGVEPLVAVDDLDRQTHPADVAVTEGVGRLADERSEHVGQIVCLLIGGHEHQPPTGERGQVARQ